MSETWFSGFWLGKRLGTEEDVSKMVITRIVSTNLLFRHNAHE